MDKELKNILDRDPIYELEKVFGREKVRNDKDFSSMVLGYSLDVFKIKDEALKIRKDSTFNTNLNEYFNIISELGFEKVLELPFYSNTWKQSDTYYIFWHSDGILLSFDTYNGNLNGGKFYYNWKPNRRYYKENPSILSSYTSYIEDNTGYPTYDEWYGETKNQAKIDLWNEKWQQEALIIGDHDCREAIKFKLANLREFGDFVVSWKKSPFLWLLHYEDSKADRYDYKKINRERISMLPKYVQEGVDTFGVE